MLSIYIYILYMKNLTLSINDLDWRGDHKKSHTPMCGFRLLFYDIKCIANQETHILYVFFNVNYFC